MPQLSSVHLSISLTNAGHKFNHPLSPNKLHTHYNLATFWLLSPFLPTCSIKHPPATSSGAHCPSPYQHIPLPSQWWTWTILSKFYLCSSQRHSPHSLHCIHNSRCHFHCWYMLHWHDRHWSWHPHIHQNLWSKHIQDCFSFYIIPAEVASTSFLSKCTPPGNRPCIEV